MQAVFDISNNRMSLLEWVEPPFYGVHLDNMTRDMWRRYSDAYADYQTNVFPTLKRWQTRPEDAEAWGKKFRECLPDICIMTEGVDFTIDNDIAIPVVL